MTVLTEAQRERVLSHDLRHKEVRQTLAGFMCRYLRGQGASVVAARDIEAALADYVEAVGITLDDAIQAYEARFRPPRDQS